jgi:hypothetical protein
VRVRRHWVTSPEPSGRAPALPVPQNTMRRRSRSTTVAALTCAVYLLVLACAAFAAPPRLATKNEVAAAQGQLTRLRVAAPLSQAGYDQDKFPHWHSTGGGCDTRDEILKRDAIRIRRTAHCTIRAGTWRDPYSGKITTNWHALDIDLVVPLANAWRSGAKRWTTTEREAYANDPGVLLAVAAHLNRQKGDDGPEQWLPPRVAFRVTYAVDWIAIKAHYRLSVTRAEERALSRLLAR